MKQLLLMVLLGATPAAELHSATQDLATSVHPNDRQFTRYLTTFNLPAAERDKAADVLRFWVNSLSSRRRFSFPQKVTDSLYRLDIRDYGWNPDSWERMTLSTRYFRLGWIDPSDEATLRKLSNSAMALVRADAFVSLTSYDPLYSDFLGLPKTIQELQAKFGIQADKVRELSLQQGGAVIRSIVALHNRQLERWPTITGYYWQSRDSLTDSGKQSVLQELTAIHVDGQEYIWTLPNGLQGYYVTDGNGKQANVVPADIAQDSVTPFRDKQVRGARSCVLCHDKGINGVQDVISKMILDGKIQLRSYDKAKIQAIEDFYLSDVTAKIETDRALFANAVKQVNGLSPSDNANRYTRFVHDYQEKLVDAETAARELGIEDFGKHVEGSYNATLLAIHAGQPVARDAWDDAYKEMAVKVYQVDR